MGARALRMRGSLHSRVSESFDLGALGAALPCHSLLLSTRKHNHDAPLLFPVSQHVLVIPLLPCFDPSTTAHVRKAPLDQVEQNLRFQISFDFVGMGGLVLYTLHITPSSPDFEAKPRKAATLNEGGSSNMMVEARAPGEKL